MVCMSGRQAGIIADRVAEFTCIHCGNIMDVSEIASFTRIQCPECEGEQRVPAQLGSFLLLEPLGSGGMGVIYKAIDQTLGRYVALKVMKKSLGDNPEFVKSFQHEARAAAALNHKNVVQIYSFGQEKGQPYIVMELVDGGRLDKMLEGGKQLDEAHALEIHIQVTEGLYAASQAGLVHGDIKPANILFGKSGEAKVVDFGLASFIGQQDTQGGEIWGTPYYIAPEKAKGRPVDFRSDIYSLGGTLFHVLTGVPPFDGDTPINVVLARLNQPAPNIQTIRPDITDQTAAMIARTLAVEPSMRHPSYLALLADMRAAHAVALKKSSPRKGVTTSVQRRVKVTKKPQFKIIAIATVLALAVVAASVWGFSFYKTRKLAAEQKAESAKIAGDLESIEKVSQRLNRLPEEITSTVQKDIFPLDERINKLTATETFFILPEIHEDFDKAMMAVSDAFHIAGLGAAILRTAREASDSRETAGLTNEIDNLQTEMIKRYNWVMESKESLNKMIPIAETKQREVNTVIAKRKQEEARKLQEERKRQAEELKKQKDAEQAEKALQELANTETKQVIAKQSEVKTFLNGYSFENAIKEIKILLDNCQTTEGKNAARILLEKYRALSELKKLIIKNIPNQPARINIRGNTQEIRLADDAELSILAPGGGTAKTTWKAALPEPRNFLSLANFYARNESKVSLDDRAQIMLGIAIFCYETDTKQHAELYADIALKT